MFRASVVSCGLLITLLVSALLRLQPQVVRLLQARAPSSLETTGAGLQEQVRLVSLSLQRVLRMSGRRGPSKLV